MEGSSRKVVCQKAQLKCLHTSACSMVNKQEELKTVMYLENYDLVAITEKWQDESHDWHTVTEGYRLFRRDRQGKGSCPLF